MELMDAIKLDSLKSHPAYQSCDQVLPLTGFSGALIGLVRTPTGLQFVRKAAQTPIDSGTIKGQARRQSWLRNSLIGAAEVPEILGEGAVDGHYYYDMEFVPYGDVNIFLKNASFDEVKVFSERIERFMADMSLLHDVNAAPTDNTAFIEKIDQIISRTSGKYGDLLAPIRNGFFETQNIVSSMKPTIVHGDLTFENILIGRTNDLWIIDSIRPPIDHYWMDWSKLFQECEGRWYGHRGKNLSAGVTHWLRNRWLKAAIEISPNYEVMHHLLLALTFARILPYAKSEKDIDFVVARVKAFGNLISSCLEKEI